MAITTSCCLNLSSPTTTHVSSKPTHQLAWHKNDKRWRRQCVVSISCMRDYRTANCRFRRRWCHCQRHDDRHATINGSPQIRRKFSSGSKMER
ncbi:hypothetical protein JRO89_XS03G0262400 [Xanthoceras sorbifolium]|uniref:Uncharacterized protein n=1 Tax=Xanthoceras sorbifolium TaxID=99658 RepID=A0ABQ8ICG6_9ROSI|nr:hypothetical protein JRO89_XS03G0262400 [Xanthoceras sorbifolium]